MTPMKAAWLMAAMAISVSVPAAIVVNEIVYRDGGAFSGSGDWIELFNDSDAARDVSGWQVKDDDDSHVYTIPGGTVIGPYGYLVVYGNANFGTVYPGVTNKVGPLTYGLGMPDAVRLYDAANDLKDEVAYKVGVSGWPDANGNGRSIELVYPYRDNSVAWVWRASESLGGSPGARNPGSIGMRVTAHNRQPDGPASADQTIITIKAQDSFAGIRTVHINADRGSGYQAQVMTPLPNDHYTVTLAPASNGTITRYYFDISNSEHQRIEYWWNNTTNEPYLFVIEDAPVYEGLVINEIMYRSLTTAWGGGASYEYVEIYNANTTSVDVSYWRFEDASDKFRLPGGLVLPPLGFLVLADKTQAVVDVYGSMLPNVRLVPLASMGLRDAGEMLAWQNANGQMIDQCDYKSSAPWPAQPNGSGPSLELRHPTNDRNAWVSWGGSAGYGTPGRHNSLFDARGLFSIDRMALTFQPGETVHYVRITSSTAATAAARALAGSNWLVLPGPVSVSNSSVLLPIGVAGDAGDGAGAVRVASMEQPWLRYEVAITVVPEASYVAGWLCGAALVREVRRWRG